jgi:predicted phage tail protein
MKDICLYGHLAECFGPLHRYEVSSIQEAMWALDVNHDGRFFKEIRKDGLYQIVCGPDLDGDLLDENQLTMQFNGNTAFHFYPIIEGSEISGKGIAMAVIGVALIATGIGVGLAGMGTAIGGFAGVMGTAVPGTFGLMTWGGVTLLGATLALSGISQLLSPSVSTDYDSREAAKDRKSSLFNGPVNTVEQGGCIPVVFGRHWIGTTVVSAALTVIDEAIDEDSEQADATWTDNITIFGTTIHFPPT